jgi:small nuclear ribonucleoprotein (snRNP)-like protein
MKKKRLENYAIASHIGLGSTCTNTMLDDVKIIWHNPEREKPLCYKSGNWDGKRSDQVLVELKDGNYIVATCYEGFMDNSHFFDWYHGVDEWELKEEEVIRWMKIPD